MSLSLTTLTHITCNKKSTASIAHTHKHGYGFSVRVKKQGRWVVPFRREQHVGISFIVWLVVELWLEAAGNDLGGGEHVLRGSLRLCRVGDLPPTNHKAHLLRLNNWKKWCSQSINQTKLKNKKQLWNSRNTEYHITFACAFLSSMSAQRT